jgi:predicted MFS family arabinose efflux permease
VALVAFGSSAAVTAVLLAAWGLIGTSAPVGWWTWLARTLPREAEAGGGLMVAVVQLAIMLGATLGGLLFDASGYQATFHLGAALLVASAILAALAARAAGRAASSS